MMDPLSLLRGRGWVDDDTIPLEQSVSDFQRFWRLPITGSIQDKATVDFLERPRVCGVPDRINSRGRLRKWRKTELNVVIASLRDWPMDANIVGQAAQETCESINAVCGLTLRLVTSTRDPDIVMHPGWIDGRGGTLAWSELPPADPCEQRYDSGERWGEVDLTAVMKHECGHACGVEHFRGRTGNLMDAIYDPGILDFQAGDIEEFQKRYGLPGEQPPGPHPPSSDYLSVEIHDVHGTRYAGRVERVV